MGVSELFQCTVSTCNETYGARGLADMHARLFHPNETNPIIVVTPSPNPANIFYLDLLKVLSQICCTSYDTASKEANQEQQQKREYSFHALCNVDGRLIGPSPSEAECIVQSARDRNELDWLAEDMHLRGNERVMEAFREGDNEVADRLKLLANPAPSESEDQIQTSEGGDGVTDDMGPRRTLSLSEGQVQMFLGYIYQGFSPHPEVPRGTDFHATRVSHTKLGYKLRRAVIRLAQASNQIPPVMYIHRDAIGGRGKDPVGWGAFGDVYSAELNGRKVALKKIRIPSAVGNVERDKAIKALCKEALLWFYLDHPNLLPFYGVDQSSFSGHTCLVSPWMPKDFLTRFLQNTQLDDDLCRRLLRDILTGLNHLHEENIVHGDLRPPNILIDEDGHARLADFGFANFKDSTLASISSLHGGPETPEHRFFHKFDMEGYLPSVPADVFAFGTICWEMYYEGCPFRRKASNLSNLEKGEYPLPLSCSKNQAPRWVMEIVERCWAWKPSERPDAKSLLSTLLR